MNNRRQELQLGPDQKRLESRLWIWNELFKSEKNAENRLVQPSNYAFLLEKLWLYYTPRIKSDFKNEKCRVSCVLKTKQVRENSIFRRKTSWKENIRTRTKVAKGRKSGLYGNLFEWSLRVKRTNRKSFTFHLIASILASFPCPNNAYYKIALVKSRYIFIMQA